MDDAADGGPAAPTDPTDDELDVTDDDYDDDGIADTTAGRGQGPRTPRPPGPLDKNVAAVAREVCRVKGWSYQDLADRVVPSHQGETWDKSRMTRFLTAKRRVTVTELADICRALEVTPEWLYQQAGVVRLPESTEGWLEADVSISAEARRSLLRQYRMEQQAAQANGG